MHRKEDIYIKELLDSASQALARRDSRFSTTAIERLWVDAWCLAWWWYSYSDGVFFRFYDFYEGWWKGIHKKEIERLWVDAWCLAWNSQSWAWFVFLLWFCSWWKGKFWRKQWEILFNARPLVKDDFGSDFLFNKILTQTKTKTMANTRSWPKPWSRPRPRPRPKTKTRTKTKTKDTLYLFVQWDRCTPQHCTQRRNQRRPPPCTRPAIGWLDILHYFFHLFVKFSPCLWLAWYFALYFICSSNSCPVIGWLDFWHLFLFVNQILARWLADWSVASILLIVDVQKKTNTTLLCFDFLHQTIFASICLKQNSKLFTSSPPHTWHVAPFSTTWTKSMILLAHKRKHKTTNT